MPERVYDLVLFGATGFTGRLTADYLAGAAAARPFAWAIAGRDAGKLETVAADLAKLGGPPPAVVIAAVDDPASLRRMAASARVLATTVGPFDRYGDGVVEACVREGCHYLDITGEPSFAGRVLERWQGEAAAAGLKIVSCCGFDSIPHDLGAWLTVRALPAGEPIQLEAFVKVDAKFSGGTWQSAIHAFSQPGRAMGTRVAAPAGRQVRGFSPRPHFEPRLGEWVAPMPTIDPWIVLRSAAALPEYGPEFRYSHNVCMGSFFSLAKGIAAVGGVVALAQLGPTRRWLQSLQPSGSGPSPARRERSHFAVYFFGRAASGAKAHVVVAGGDPGYTETSKMLAESALCLVHGGAGLPAAAGVLTPAVALGDRLVARLREAGLKLDLIDAAAA
jgi:short subunit dehydrogenase-like uncharacterized protein